MKRYKNEINKDEMEIYYERISKKTYWFIAVIDKTTIKDKEFENKSEALAYAHGYMREH